MSYLKGNLKLKITVFLLVIALIFWLMPSNFIFAEGEEQSGEEIVTEETSESEEENPEEEVTEEEVTEEVIEEETEEEGSEEEVEETAEETVNEETTEIENTGNGSSEENTENSSDGEIIDEEATEEEITDEEVMVEEEVQETGTEIVEAEEAVITTLTLSTDKSDYLPEDTVLISGSGYEAGKTLIIRIINPNGSVEEDFLVVNSDGSISYSHNLVNGMMATYYVQIIDSEMNEALSQCSFTDADGILEVGSGNPGSFSSIQEAVNAAIPGATINVYPGTYTSNFCGPTPTGVQTKPPFWTNPNDCYAPPLIVWKDDLVIQAVDPDSTTNTIIMATVDAWSNIVAIQASTGGTWNGSSMVGAGVNPDFGSAPNAISIIANNVVIRGFNIQNPYEGGDTYGFYNTAGVMIGGLYAGDDGNYQVMQDGSTYIIFDTGESANGAIIENCVFSDLWHAVYIWHSDDNIIQDNIVGPLGNTNHWAAISVYDGYNAAQVSLSDGSQGNQFLNNSIADKGIAVGAWDPPINTNNSFTRIIGNETTQIGMTFTDSEDVCIKDNTVYGTANPSGLWSYAANINHYLTSIAGPNGTITPEGLTIVGFKGSQTYTITPDAGYYIADIIVDGESSGSVEEYTFSDVTCRHTIKAIFAPIPGKVTVIKTDPSGALLDGAGFTIYYKDSGNPVMPEAFTSGGMVTFSGLAWGTYIIVETTPPAGYDASDPVEVTIDASNAEAGVTVSRIDTPTAAAGGAGITVLGIATPGGGVEVLGIQELPFTGLDPIIPITGISTIIAGGLMVALSTIRKRFGKK